MKNHDQKNIISDDLKIYVSNRRDRVRITEANHEKKLIEDLKRHDEKLAEEFATKHRTKFKRFPSGNIYRD